ncbi:MAG: potassium channel family protein [Nocardiopsaceae bacterium]|jgi:voltage-gated potassium channel|nr:potassium channel family protein [Nocardiopsaceae bacterium]
MLLAAGLLVVSAVIVYLGRGGYRDTAHPGQPLSVLASVYYAAITLSTTGYGDIIPVSDNARLVNTVVITPLRVIFLIVLVGTTLGVLTERARMNWRIARWRTKMTDQVIVVGYGSKGRAAIRTLSESGVHKQAIVVIDTLPEAVAEANAAGLAAVAGDGTRTEVLRQAKIESARQLVITVSSDDTAVLIALTARQLNPSLTIAAAVREGENRSHLLESGADHVVMSSDAAGQMLAISTVRPAAAKVIAELLGQGRSLDLYERLADEAELGASARAVAGAVIAVLRAGNVVPPDDPRAARLQKGDQLIFMGSRAQPAAPA